MIPCAVLKFKELKSGDHFLMNGGCGSFLVNDAESITRLHDAAILRCTVEPLRVVVRVDAAVARAAALEYRK